MPLHDVVAEQRSAGWHHERAGSVTGSVFADAISFTRTGAETAARRNLRLQKTVERLTGIPHEGFRTASMDWGTRTEPIARDRYMLHTGSLVEEVGFIEHPTIEWCGVSVDGLVEEDGTIEIKCPNPETHMRSILMRNKQLGDLLLGKEGADKLVPVPEEYIPQVQGGLMVTGRKWCDFISFDPRFPKHLQLYVHRVWRDDAYIAKLEAGLVKFLDEVQTAVAAMLEVPQGAEPGQPAPSMPNDPLAALAALRRPK